MRRCVRICQSTMVNILRSVVRNLALIFFCHITTHKVILTISIIAPVGVFFFILLKWTKFELRSGVITCINSSVSRSTAAVASSKTNILLLRKQARAKHINCLWPTLEKNYISFLLRNNRKGNSTLNNFFLIFLK